MSTATMTTTSNQAEESHVIHMLAREMYLRFCEHKAFTPRAAPYADAGCIDYASIAVKFLGWDSIAISQLEAAQ